MKTVGHLVVTAELPGISPDDVDVSLDGDILFIKGEENEEREVSEDDRYIHERTYGSFQRRTTVGRLGNRPTSLFCSGLG